MLAALTFLASACIPEGLAFVQDDRLEIVAPEDHTTVKAPFTLDWRVEDFEVTGPDGQSRDDAGYFGIFIDASPVPPGKTLEWIAHEDRQCRGDSTCPNKAYLADRGVYAATETSFTVRRLTDLDAYGGHERHEISVILLDGTGRRIGESAWWVTVFYDRDVLL